jgi:hypothetical protein
VFTAVSAPYVTDELDWSVATRENLFLILCVVSSVATIVHHF